MMAPCSSKWSDGLHADASSLRHGIGTQWGVQYMLLDTVHQQKTIAAESSFFGPGGDHAAGTDGAAAQSGLATILSGCDR
jgi:hypothetical protein